MIKKLFEKNVDKILHCRPCTILNDHLTNLFISPWTKQNYVIWINYICFVILGYFAGFCPIFTNEGYLQWSPCKDTACPTSSYRSDEVYQCKSDVSVCISSWFENKKHIVYDKDIALWNFKNVFYFIDPICYENDNPKGENTGQGWV